MIVLNGYKSYLFVQFEEFCKEKNIITFYFFTHSSYIIQPLDVDCFNVLKQLYNQEFEDLIKTYINHIIKTEFFIVFKIAYLNTIVPKNIQAGFRGIGLILYNLQIVLLKFDVKLQIPISTGPFFL